MSEVDQDYVPTRAGKFRTSRYPGFVGGQIDPNTGNYVPGAVGVNPTAQSLESNVGNESNLGNYYYEPPETEEAGLVGGLAESAVGGAATYAGDVVGGAVGETLGAGGTFSQGISKGASALGDKVSSVFSGGAETAAADVVAKGAAPSLAPTSGVPQLASPAETANFWGGGSSGGAAAPSEAAPSLASGTLGSAAGVGIATTGIGLLTGQEPAKALKSGAGSAVGFALGSLVPVPGAPYIGATIGNAIGGRVICTELNRQGQLSDELLSIDLEHSTAHISDRVRRGYWTWAPSVVLMMRRSRRVTALVRPLAIARAHEIAYQMGRRSRPHWGGRLVRWIGEPLCWVVGGFVKTADFQHLYDEESST